MKDKQRKAADKQKRIAGGRGFDMEWNSIWMFFFFLLLMSRGGGGVFLFLILLLLLPGGRGVLHILSQLVSGPGLSEYECMV